MITKKNTLMLHALWCSFICTKILGATVDVQIKETPSTKGSKTTQSTEQVIFMFNQEKLLADSLQVKYGREEIQELDATLYKDMSEHIAKMQTLQKKIETNSKKSPSATPDQEKDQQELAQMYQEFQMKSQQGQDQLKRKELEIMTEFRAAEAEATEAFLKKEGNQNVILIPIDSSIYVHPGFDKTEDILLILNAKYEQKKKSTKNNESKKENKKEAQSEKSTAAKKPANASTKAKQVKLD